MDKIDGFEKWFKDEYHNTNHPSVYMVKRLMQKAWQESAKQERKRIVGMINKTVKILDESPVSYNTARIYEELADRIEGEG